MGLQKRGHGQILRDGKTASREDFTEEKAAALQEENDAADAADREDD